LKLSRYIQDDTLDPAVFADDTTLLNCSSFGEDWNESFFQNDGLRRLKAFLAEEQNDLPSVQSCEVTLAPAIARPSKIICIGLNYAAHAAEAGMDKPSEPIVFVMQLGGSCPHA
jgi:2-keto-4-pentenoate hydratase/2-oxohepta-3-ene-1,7-dioic acid hydratase in catechol pathway